MLHLESVFLIAVLLVFSAFSYAEKDLTQEVASYMSSIKTMSCTIKNLDKEDDSAELFLESGTTPQIRIKQKNSNSQDIWIYGSTLIILDPKSGKIQKTPISSSPIYQLLTGKFDFKKHKIETIIESKEGVAYSVDKRKDGHIPLKLVFAKYPNGNLKYLIGWEIDDGKNITKYAVIEETIRINDKKTVPDSVFKLPSEK